MEVRQLEYFLAVVEEGTFTRAAEREMVAQPSLSQQIHKLETELGQQLFDRLPRKAVPTEAGQRLAEHARRVLAELRSARQNLRELDGQVTGQLIVGAIPTVAPYLLPAVVNDFARRFPEVALEIHEDVTARLGLALGRGELDLAIVSATEPLGEVDIESLGMEELWLVVSAKHPLARRVRVPWKELRGQPFLVLHEMHCLSEQVMELCQPHKLRPRVVSHGDQLATLAGLVAAGMGVTLVPAMMKRNDTTPGRCYVQLSDPPPRRPLAIAWNPRRHRSNAAGAFATVVHQVLRG